MIRILGVIGVLSVLGFAAAPNFVIQPDSRIWVVGQSTVRGFTCTAAAVQGTIDSGERAAPPSLENLAAAVSSVELKIDVAQLACGNGTMDGHMKKALKAAEHGTIEYRMDGYSASPPSAGTSTLELRGTLRIAGADQPIVMTAAATQESDGTLRVQGSQSITMSDWGVKPPSLMLGTMKVKDDVVVNFDIRLRQQ
jgi:polyisoprenoid-binding protein YceI